MPKKIGHYEIFRSRNKEFCWRFIKNGRELYRCSETYKRKGSAKKSITSAMNSATSEIIDFTLKGNG